MENKTKTYVWGIPTRLFHWMLVVSLIGAYIAEEDFLTLHVALGYAAGLLIIMRLCWGLIGPQYSHFRDFPIGIKSLSGFFKEPGKPGKVYTGHNPLASLVMLGILVMVLVVVVTGLLTLNQEGGQGLLKSITLPAGIEFKEVHEVCVQIMIGLAILHLIGLISDLIIHKSASVLKSMFSGYKSGVTGKDAEMSTFQKVFSFVWIAGPLLAFYLTLTGPPVQLKEEAENESTEMYENSSEEEKGDD
ncbi:MAG: hypothetical protein HGA37_11805 [Lentimicrobium sp.]|nr:hypothetical protein [Lentimicrobium sp.]